MALVLGQRFGVFEYFGFEEGFVRLGRLLKRLGSFGVELEGGLVELQRFFDLNLLGVVDLILDLVIRLDVERMPGRLNRISNLY